MSENLSRNVCYQEHAMLDDVKFYRDLGFSVMPLEGKRPPMGFSWKHLTERPARDDELRTWFAGKGRNLGLICGRVSGIVALDADSQDVAATIERLLPKTDMITVTARGAHFFYRLEAGQRVPTKIRVKGMTLDLKAESSYVVAAHSIHPDTGKPYTRMGSWNLGKVPFFSVEWFAVGHDGDSARRGAVRSPIQYISHIWAVSGQGGHNATYRVACLLRDTGLSEGQALAAMIQWNERNAEPPWTLRELLHKVTDAYSRASERLCR
jgi:hypothetical protein